MNLQIIFFFFLAIHITYSTKNIYTHLNSLRNPETTVKQNKPLINAFNVSVPSRKIIKPTLNYNSNKLKKDQPLSYYDLSKIFPAAYFSNFTISEIVLASVSSVFLVFILIIFIFFSFENQNQNQVIVQDQVDENNNNNNGDNENDNNNNNSFNHYGNNV